MIQKSLQDALAEEILTGRIGDGDTVEVSADDAGLLINGSAASRAEAA